MLMYQNILRMRQLSNLYRLALFTVPLRASAARWQPNEKPNKLSYLKNSSDTIIKFWQDGMFPKSLIAMHDWGL